MNAKDYIGSRGEDIFQILITTFRGGRPLFSTVFMGKKHESTDFMVELVEPISGHAHFFVQVKSTTARYTGKGQERRIDVRLSKEDVEKLKTIRIPTYVVGIDIDHKMGLHRQDHP